MMRALSGITPEFVVLTTTCVLLFASYRFETTSQHENDFRRLFGLLAVVSIGCFFNFGTFHGKGRFVHEHEQYHFFLGSKYLEELRYDAIYDAALLAAVESGIFESSTILRRDPQTFELTRDEIAPERETQLRDRFTPERWEQFRTDVEWFGDSRKYLVDRGNTGSPAWAMLANIFTRHLSINRSTARLLGALDLLLLTLLFLVVWRTFGERTLSLTMIVGLSVPLVNGYLGGSILRMDWIVALGLSLCLFEKRHFRTAGILLGYAIAIKLLAAIMVLPFGLRFLVETVRRRSVNREHLRYIAYAWVGLAFFVLASATYFGDPQLWQDYFQRLLVTLHQHFYYGQHSFRDLFLQAYHDPGSIWSPTPAQLAAAHPQNSVDALRALFLTAQLLLLAGLTIVAVRNPVRFAFSLGPLAIFVVLVTNRYYWQTWTIAAITLAPTYRRDWRHLAYLSSIVAWLAVGQFIAHSPQLSRWRGYAGSYALFWLGAAVLGFEFVAWWRERRRATRSVSA